MFKAVPQGQYIASKSQAIKPDVVSDVSPLEQIRILLPSYLGFVDPTQTFLRAVVSVSGGRGQIVPDYEAGVHSLFRNVIIRDGSNIQTLESLEDYNAMVGMMKHFTEQSTISHKRQLFEGVQPTATHENSLYYGAAPSLTGATSSAPVTTARTRNSPEVYLQLDTGLFNSSRILPVALLDGLRMFLDTEDPQRCLYMLDQGQGVGAFNTAGQFIIPGTEIRPSADIASSAFTVTGTDNVFTIVTDLACGDDQKENPFVIDDLLHIALPASGTEQYDTVLGLITGFFIDTGKLGIQFRPQRSNGDIGSTFAASGSVLFVKSADRVSAKTGIFTASDAPGAAATGSLAAPSYTLSGVEMRCLSVQPPDAYVKSMVDKSASGAGIAFDILTSELHRHNQVATSGITQDHIPSLAKRAKSVLVQPIPNNNYRQITEHSFSGVPDSARNYQFQFGTELVPSRRANLERYSQSPAKVEPLHMTELQKALANIGRSVHSLQKINEHFAIGRAFNRYGQVTDISDETISLRVDYDSGAVQKVFNNYVFKLARIQIAEGIVSVSS